MKLLIVDDSELIRYRLVGLLQHLPEIRTIKTAGSLHEALYIGSHLLPDLIVLDLHLPDGNAIKIIPLLKRLRTVPRIAVLTNDASTYNREQCTLAGADWFFDKSIEFEQLLELLQTQVLAPPLPPTSTRTT